MTTDAIMVFPAGFRLTNAAGDVVSGGKLKFYNAGGLVARTVYSNSGLSSSLGTTVYTGSDGLPVASSGSSTEVSVYTGTTAYKIIFTTSADVEIWTLDNLLGALDTSTFLTSGSTSTLSIPVTSKTGNYTLVAADRGKCVQANTSGGNFTLTLDAAATLGDGWNAEVRNSGTSGQVMLAASQAIAFEGQTFTTRALQIGEAFAIRCDGTAFKITAHTPPLMASRNPAVITITDRVTSDPGAPTPGARYIVQTGYGSYATGDIIEANNVSFNKYTPPTDCGWIAYVQDEDTYYSFQGSAWISTKATQAEAEAGTSVVPFMTPLSTRQSLAARGYGEYTTSSDLSATIPVDDTIPQSNEGDQIVTATITLKKSDSRVRASFSGFGGTTTDTPHGTVAIFFDGSANALNAKNVRADSDGGAINYYNLDISVEHAPGSVGPFTYQVRTGWNGATYRINGSNSGRLFGGAARATLILQEVFV